VIRNGENAGALARWRSTVTAWAARPHFWALVTALAAGLVYLSTLQWGINGSQSPYATDVGEIQNALPRWGTIHFTGYPAYTLLGSLFVSLLRLLRVEPAAACSLYSALWAMLTISLLVLLSITLGAPHPLAALSGMLAAVTASFWIDASLAEVHTMSAALTVATLLFAVRFWRSGNRRELFWLTLAFTQGIAHQRAVAFLAPAVGVLIYPHWRVLWRERRQVVLLAALAPLSYLYLPVRAWQGAEWTFGQPGTWHGFWTMILDTKAERILSLPESLGDWWMRARLVAQLLHDDLPLPLLVMGLAGLLAHGSTSRRECVAFHLAVWPYVALCLIIWEGRVSDALLAAKLPVVLLSTLGLALLVSRWWRRGRGMRIGIGISLTAMAAVLLTLNRPRVLAITRDPAAQDVIQAAAEIPVTSQEHRVLVALWGHDYWALAYAQKYHHALSAIELVDHNADFEAITARGDELLALEKVFYVLPLDWWQGRLGPVALDHVSSEVVRITPKPERPLLLSTDPLLDLGNGIQIANIETEVASPDLIYLTVYWQAVREAAENYSVGVHLLAKQPPTSPEDILAQADRANPVGGWYPTSLWSVGEMVRDQYELHVPEGSHPVALRVSMYRISEAGQFVNSPWLVIPLEGG